MSQHKLKTKNTSIRYIKHSSRGVPIILVHGGPGIVGYMESLGALICEQGQIIEYFQRGTFESPSKGPFTVNTHIADLHALVRLVTNKEKPIIIGHSWGAALALAYGAKYKKAAQKIIVIGTGALTEKLALRMGKTIESRLSKASKQKNKNLKRQILIEKDNKNKSLLDLAYLKEIIKVYNVSPRSFKCVNIRLRNVTTADKSAIDYQRKKTNNWFVNKLSQINIPVIGFHGNDDPVPVTENTAFLKKHIKNYKEYTYQKTGHFPWLEPVKRQKFIKDLKKEL